MPTDTQAKSNGVPPVDKTGEVNRAALALKRCRREIDELPAEWQHWVAGSLLAGIRDEAG